MLIVNGIVPLIEEIDPVKHFVKIIKRDYRVENRRLIRREHLLDRNPLSKGNLLALTAK